MFPSLERCKCQRCQKGSKRCQFTNLNSHLRHISEILLFPLLSTTSQRFCLLDHLISACSQYLESPDSWAEWSWHHELPQQGVKFWCYWGLALIPKFYYGTLTIHHERLVEDRIDIQDGNCPPIWTCWDLDIIHQSVCLLLPTYRCAV